MNKLHSAQRTYPTKFHDTPATRKHKFRKILTAFATNDEASDGTSTTFVAKPFKIQHNLL